MATKTEAVLEGPSVTVGFERSIKVKDYETAKALIFVQVPTEPGDDLEAIVAAAKPTFYAAKSVVLEQLGIDFEVTPELVIHEVERNLGAVQVSPAHEARATARASSAPVSSNAAPATRDEQWAELASNPSKWFDNRQSKRGRQPDFKRKGTGEGLWLDKKPAGVVVPDEGAFS